MSQIRAWTPYFRGSVRMRGREYHLSGKVEQLPPEAGEWIRAVVHGTRDYVVTIRGEGPASEVKCTCPFFSGGNYCKHIWAAILSVVSQNGEVDSSGSGREWGEGSESAPPPPKARKRDGSRASKEKREPDWARALSFVRIPWRDGQGSEPATFLPKQVCYVVSVEQSRVHQGLVIELHQQQAGRTGVPRVLRLDRGGIGGLAEAVDRELCSLMMGAAPIASSDAERYTSSSRPGHRYMLGAGSRRVMLRQMIQTGRCLVDLGDSDRSGQEGRRLMPLRWDGEGDWVLCLCGSMMGEDLCWSVELRRGEERMPVMGPELVLGGIDGVVIYEDKVAGFDDRGAYRWISLFRDLVHGGEGQGASVKVGARDIPRFLDQLYGVTYLPEVDFPDGVGRIDTGVPLAMHLELQGNVSSKGGNSPSANKGLVTAKAWFAYGKQKVKPGLSGQYLAVSDSESEDAEGGEGEQEIGYLSGLIRRDLDKERAALAALTAADVRPHPEADLVDAFLGVVPVKKVVAAVDQLARAGWIITADRRVVRRAAAPRLTISSGIDWFELHGGIAFSMENGKQEMIDLPKILAAAREGKSMVTLSDGSQGMLPEQWLKEHGLLASMGEAHEDHLRFSASQAALLNSLLDEQELVSFDEGFGKVRDRIKHFEGIEAVEPGETFKGELRPYQKEGLGWLGFWGWLGTGGILADDMGLGKTVQILAMLDKHYDAPGGGKNEKNSEEAGGDEKVKQGERKPTLIVVPRSVVFNWIDEASRFTPKLRVQSYTGSERETLRAAFADHDVIVTSYGLMRRDVMELREHRFEYVVLDEAQLIKNPASQVARAARLLQAEHRLALTGTPVENHLGDLWSIFDFLNPGVLGGASGFARTLREIHQGYGQPSQEEGVNGQGDEAGQKAEGDLSVPGTDAAVQLSRAMRPFILRRTKTQVLRELPEKTEQTILCQMEQAQRDLYDQLLRHYKGTLLSQLPTAGGGGLGRSAIAVIEALLRLRQASCHPGLIDPKLADQPSAKMEVLLERVTDLIEEGHKALVFSQFTSMLALVRKRLDERKITYEYLDGKTRNREVNVRRFQSDPKCPVFLVSLKAGGLGLNLTAAEYVFILDPWWNPAVESQAIDRAHRLGQTRHVFAYRLICENTVEQRIAQLQEKKKQLADMIIGGQEGLLSSLTRDDLEMLLS